ncbi:MAG TPA: hypothetical protein VFX59_25660 [Polyangiales bacterium]|nr:hypothetical protein [Polyangiales bacterium]
MRLVGYLLGVSLAACAVPVTAPARPVEADPAAWLPRVLGRCLVVMPSRVDPAHLEQVMQVSQSDGVPYRLQLAAYARIEQDAGRVELLRFANPPAHAVVRAQLASSLERRACGLGPCDPARAAWLDARTLRVERGRLSEGESACAPMLREYPRALELAARPPSIASGELRETQLVLEPRAGGLERTSRRRFASPEAAERALRAVLRGQEELPMLGGVPAEDFGERVGDRLEQRAYASFADLQLALDERTRQRTIDPSDRASVYAAFDAAPERHEELLLAARARAPQDDGLLRRHFQLLFARDPRAALELAGQGPAWELRKRAALARFDEQALARALEQAHSLRDGTRMARELAEKNTAAFEDPAPREERAEYAYLAAAQIAKVRVARGPLAARVAVLELPRLLATLAEAVRAPIAVELLVFTADANTLGAGRPAQLHTAADDAQLRALGKALASATEEGPFELRLSFSQRATLAISGRREGGWLLIDSGSRALRGLRWDAIERLVAAPLRQLTGSAFPPDELTIEARDEAELGALEQSASRVARCSRAGLSLHCRGGLADASAARRALLAVVHDQLGADARLLWSGSE